MRRRREDQQNKGEAGKVRVEGHGDRESDGKPAVKRGGKRAENSIKEKTREG